jgi:hypothetical protein
MDGTNSINADWAAAKAGLLKCHPDQYRYRAVKCANRAAMSSSHAGKQKFADLAIVWLMLATELENQALLPSGDAGSRAKGSKDLSRRSRLVRRP